ncbi:MAG: serine hydrolase, partial [Verrucomicrobiota bacterium]
LLPALWILALATSHGHNGGSMVAEPVEGIRIDGDLSEWPDTLTAYPLRHADFGDQPRNAEDLQAEARIGYDAEEKAIYVAVEVRDDSIVVDPEAGQAWDTQDGCSLYIDRTHLKDVSTPIQYFQCGDQFRVHGNTENQTKVVCKFQRRPKRITYEWRVPLKEAFRSGRSLGFDIDVTDKDDDGSFTWTASTPGTQKAYFGANLGDLFLLEKGARLGTVTGRLHWDADFREVDSASDEKAARPGLVAFQSDLNPWLRVQAKCDAEGFFEAKLPGGTYVVHPVDAVKVRVFEADHLHLTIEPDTHQTLPPLPARPLPKPGLIGKKGTLHEKALNPEDIDLWVQRHMDYHKIPGVLLAIVKDSEIAYTRTYGVENAGTGVPLRAESVFEACSLTKPIFAFAVNRLVERGLIDLDEPLDTYLPEARGYADFCTDKEKYRRITARHVLTHRTGFPNWRSGKEIPITFEPGEAYGYSGEGFELLGAVVSHLTKKDLIQVVTEEAFNPLGIDNAHLIWSDQLAARVGNGHTNGRHPIPKSKTDYPGMAYSLHINAPDYARFIVGLLKREGLKESTYDEMLRTQYTIHDPNNPHEYPYGLGLVSEDTEFGKKYWHSGSNPGWKCLFAAFDELKMGYVVFTNNDEGHAFGLELEQFLITGAQEKKGAD